MPVTAWPPDRVEIAWGVLAVFCLAAMIAWPSWETIPFHIIWITLTLLYGFRVWSPAVTGAVLGAVIIATGASILSDAFEGFSSGASSSRYRSCPRCSSRWCGMRDGAR